MINDEDIESLFALAKKMRIGCTCDIDDRCTNCENMRTFQEQVRKLEGKMRHYQSWPTDWPVYCNGTKEACDTKVGPCCCGAWHQPGEFELEHGVLTRRSPLSDHPRIVGRTPEAQAEYRDSMSWTKQAEQAKAEQAVQPEVTSQKAAYEKQIQGMVDIMPWQTVNKVVKPLSLPANPDFTLPPIVSVPLDEMVPMERYVAGRCGYFVGWDGQENGRTTFVYETKGDCEFFVPAKEEITAQVIHDYIRERIAPELQIHVTIMATSNANSGQALAEAAWGEHAHVPMNTLIGATAEELFTKVKQYVE